MINTCHIQTLKFELDIPTVSLNRDVQNRLVSLFNQQYTKMLDEVFTTYNDKTIFLDSLTLELEPVILDELEQSLTEQSREKLLAFLSKYGEHDYIVSDTIKPSIGKQFLNPLLYYLIHGTQPWQASIDNFDNNWKTALNNPKFIDECHNIRWSEQSILRLVQHLNNNLYRLTIKKLVPQDATHLEYCQKWLLNVLSNTEKFKNVSKHQLQLTMWGTILDYILICKEEISIATTLRYCILKLGNDYDLEEQNLKINLAKTIEEGKNIGLTLSEQKQIIDALDTAKKVSDFQKDANKTFESIKSVEEWLYKPDKSHNEVTNFKKWVVEPRNRREMQQYWIEPLQSETLKLVVKAMSPEASEVVLNYHKVLFTKPDAAIVQSFGTFKRAVWTLTIDYFSHSFSSVFHVKEFVKYHTNRLTNRYALKKDDLLQQLISNVKLLPKSSFRNNELLYVLKSLLTSKNTTTSFKKTEDENLIGAEQVLKFLQGEKPVSSVAAEQLRLWLHSAHNLKQISTKIQSQSNSKVLHKIVKVVYPKHAEFMIRIIDVLVHLFTTSSRFHCSSKELKSAISVYVVEYRFKNSSGFQRSHFLYYMLTSLLAHFNVPYKMLLQSYKDFMITTNQSSSLLNTEFLAYFNEQQGAVEAAHRVVPKKSNSQLTIEEIVGLLTVEDHKKGEKRNNDGIFSNRALFIKMQNDLEFMITRQPEIWFNYLKSNPLASNVKKSFYEHIRVSLLRAFYQFDRSFIKWQKINKYVTKSGRKEQVTNTLFFIEEAVWPPWVIERNKEELLSSGLNNLDIKTLNSCQWSSLKLQNWTRLLSNNAKTNWLAKQFKNNKNHVLVTLYSQLSQVYYSLPTTFKQGSFFAFEVQYWTVFFRALKRSENLLSGDFAKIFFKLWRQDTGYAPIEDQEVQERLKTSAYFPKALVRSLYKSLYNKSENVPRDLAKRSELKKVAETNVDQLTKWHLSNGGLVILHVFLQHLFKRLNYLTPLNKFKDKTTSFRAVYLLHFLATGKTRFKTESELAMAKVLCGLNIITPVPRTVRLKKTEKQTAIELLEVVIERWDKLGKTSVKGLQNTFISREGVLEDKEDTYQLTLESSGTDVLLDYLPWNINLVKLPWNNKIIYVSWR